MIFGLNEYFAAASLISLHFGLVTDDNVHLSHKAQDFTTLLGGKQGLISDKCGDTTTVGGFSIPRPDDCLQ